LKKPGTGSNMAAGKPGSINKQGIGLLLRHWWQDRFIEANIEISAGNS